MGPLNVEAALWSAIDKDNTGIAAGGGEGLPRSRVPRKTRFLAPENPISGPGNAKKRPPGGQFRPQKPGFPAPPTGPEIGPPPALLSQQVKKRSRNSSGWPPGAGLRGLPNFFPYGFATKSPGVTSCRKKHPHSRKFREKPGFWPNFGQFRGFSAPPRKSGFFGFFRGFRPISAHFGHFRPQKSGFSRAVTPRNRVFRPAGGHPARPTRTDPGFSPGSRMPDAAGPVFPAPPEK